MHVILDVNFIEGFVPEPVYIRKAALKSNMNNNPGMIVALNMAGARQWRIFGMAA